LHCAAVREEEGMEETDAEKTQKELDEEIKRKKERQVACLLSFFLSFLYMHSEFTFDYIDI
jgi:hypothetical protein